MNLKTTLDNSYYMLYNASTMNKLLKQLEEYRLENRLSQQKLAEVLGVSFATVNRWFNGRTEPNQIQTYHIEKLLNQGKPKK
jgi:transcriptional regulator with XRE-family HTH domain